MVEEKKEDQGSVPTDEPISIGKQIASFVLTLIVIPFLFAGTCTPIGWVLIEGHSRGVRHVGFAIYGVAFMAILVWQAIRTRNPGVRWGIIVMGLIIATILLVLLVR